MSRTCAQCGMVFEAKRSTAKFCGSSCRANAATGKAPTSSPVGPEPSGIEPHLVRVTRVALEQADRMDSPAGAAALVAAERAAKPGTSDSAVASLLKAHGDALEKALRGTARPVGPGALADQLAERRARRGA